MKKPIFKFGLLLAVIFLFQELSSQENFLHGYIINKKGDTLSGFIDYRNWSENPKEIRFKNKLENIPNLYSPTNIIEFSVKDEIYLSGIVDTEISSDNIEDANLKIKPATVFLQTLFRGNKSLYYYKDEYSRDNFYIQQDKNFMLLIHKEYLKETTIVVNNKYKGQLTLYLSDCSSIQQHINSSAYREKSLVEVFKKYYECDENAQLNFQLKEEKTTIEKGLIIGASITSLKFKSEEKYLYLTADYNKSTNLSAGVFLNFVLPRNQGKWSIYNEILFSSYKTSNLYENYENENIYDITTTKIGYSFIKLNNLFRFKHPIGKLSLFYNAGISNGFVISEENYAKFEKNVYSVKGVREGTATDNPKKSEHGFIIGSGLEYNKLSFEARYELLTGGFYEKHSLNRFYFLLSYSL